MLEKLPQCGNLSTPLSAVIPAVTARTVCLTARSTQPPELIASLADHDTESRRKNAPKTGLSASAVRFTARRSARRR